MAEQLQYPGRIIKRGETDKALVRQIKSRLNEVLGPDPDFRLDTNIGEFGAKMESAVMLFQSRHVDAEGRALKQDGQIGALTWGALFGAASLPPEARPAAGGFQEQVLLVAAQEVEALVREVPRNSNSGPRVNQYLASVGLGPGYAWCCAFVYFCHQEAAQKLGRPNPMVRTGGCLNHWNKAPAAGAQRLLAADARNDPARVLPGMIFVMDHGAGLGHTGLVESSNGGWLTTIEGNTDASKTREGGGVYRLQRKIGEINKGFLLYR
ncbi:CHAP domain-containing protein [Azohydromonas aeria]|uniref:CHAP domain-containing protein n=1 Tax=Azohydromonas aeria TaxID=2590212 RepID=UPI0012F78861|nr:CHAP domain-containing protein [Azohydromonas aeria]